MSKFVAPLVAAVVFLSLGGGLSAATVYTVGDAAGWDTSADLSSWTTNKTFVVGDALWFQYSQYHSVHEVDKAGHDRCSTSGAVLDGSVGNTTVPLAAPGRRYFICGVLSHCLGGMRLQVDVGRTAGAGGPSPAGTPSETPPGSTGDRGGGTPSAASGDNRRQGLLAAAWSCAVVGFWAFAA